MSTETLQSFNWLRKIPGELYAIDEKPLLGFPPPFPWDKFSQEVGNALQIKDLSITPGQTEWRTPQTLLAGLGDKVRSILLAVSPIEGPLWFATSEKGLKQLINLLTGAPHNPEQFVDPDFLNAYFEFIAIEAVGAFERACSDKKMTASIGHLNDTPSEACLGIDITIQCKTETIYGRLLLSQSFKKGWAQRYQQQQEKLSLESPIADSLEVMVHLEAGKVNLSPSEWQQVTIGDFVLIDSCSLDPNEDKGRVMLVINGTPCFRAKIKQGSLKILEHPLYHEVDKSMPTPPSKNEPAHQNEEEDFFDEDEEEHHEDAHAEEHHDDLEDEDFDIEEDEDDIEKSTSAKPPKPAAERPPAAADKKAATSSSSESAPSKTPLNVDEIPLPVVIEVGRIQMSVKKLLELQPGNMLELDIHPEAGVDMVVNGKRIARGELLRIGEALGLRITELS